MKVINGFLQAKVRPEWMTIKYLPVIPPNLRPIIQLKEKVMITTDLNLFYSNIINSNNKIKKLRKMSVPEIFLNGEKNILQNKVDKLIISNKNDKINKRTKSIVNNIQGKKGRFRENLLGKTVDYSGRSVIIIEPKLDLKECGIPIKIGVDYNFRKYL
jgi:DNA-directed RNA polymerase subunit beta'